MSPRVEAVRLPAPAGYEISTDPGRLDAGLIHRWLSEDSYWALVTVARDHLAPFGLRRVMLATSDAHGVYAKLGFEPLTETGKWMVLGAQ